MKLSINTAFKSKCLVRVHRIGDAVNDVDGFVVGVSKEWLLFRAVDPFRPDGFYFFRRDTIRRLRSDVYLKFRQRVLQRERLLAESHQCPPVDLTNTRSILAWLQQEDRFVIVWRETEDDWLRRHCRIVAQYRTKVSMRLFDGAGKWERENGLWPIDEITAIRFDSHYLRTFERYADKDVMGL